MMNVSDDVQCHVFDDRIFKKEKMEIALARHVASSAHFSEISFTKVSKFKKYFAYFWDICFLFYPFLITCDKHRHENPAISGQQYFTTYRSQKDPDVS